jgi:cellulose synthase/poly-beta-1,6-N-acetylglucosamine synthase-like glycosyltransferase
MAWGGDGRVLARAASDVWHSRAPERPGDHACPELDCLRDVLPSALLAAAERRAAEVGVGADRVLIAAGLIDEDAYLRWLAQSLGVAQEPLGPGAWEACPLNDDRLVDAAMAGLLPLRVGGELVWVIAPRHLAARTLTAFVARFPDFAARLRLTTRGRLNNFIAQHAADALGRRAARALDTRWPHLSAASIFTRLPVALVLTAAAALAGLVTFPLETVIALNALFAAGFVGWLAMRLFSSWIEPPLPRTQRIPDHALPVYSIIVALYREASSVGNLIGALNELDYPPEKLDIKIVLEPDDLETRAAIARQKLAPHFEVILTPATAPRTKPKALNAALRFARGSFVAVYDAEDRPEPNQLRRALDVLLTGDETVACGQACLTIDNTDDGWLARLFTAEYAAQFDLFLPGLAAMRLPLPLGGSSNHFRTSVLRKIGAWDAFNVTEDADLGVRLARFGYRSAVIASTTYEEAPARFGIWLRQRTRWLKGWMLTWGVHMRSPRRLWSEIGPAGFLTFQLVVGGNVLAALIHPLFLLWLAYAIAAGQPILGGESVAAATIAWAQAMLLVAGYATSIVLGVRGLARRGLLKAAWSLLFVPIYWLFLSLAAWRALIQLIRNPHHWEKTAHGLARTSRLARLGPHAPAGRPDETADAGAPPRRKAAA